MQTVMEIWDGKHAFDSDRTTRSTMPVSAPAAAPTRQKQELAPGDRHGHGRSGPGRCSGASSLQACLDVSNALSVGGFVPENRKSNPDTQQDMPTRSVCIANSWKTYQIETTNGLLGL